MHRDRISITQSIKMASRVFVAVVALSIPLGMASQGAASGPSFIEDSSAQGGGVGFVLLMSLQRAG